MATQKDRDSVELDDAHDAEKMPHTHLDERVLLPRHRLHSAQLDLFDVSEATDDSLDRDEDRNLKNRTSPRRSGMQERQQSEARRPVDLEGRATLHERVPEKITVRMDADIARVRSQFVDHRFK